MRILFDPSVPDAPGASSTPSVPDANVPAPVSSASAPADANTPDNTKPFDEQAAAATAKRFDKEPVVPAAPSAAEPAPTKPALPGDVQNPNKTEELRSSGEFEDLPFHKHERFQQVVKERKEFKESLERIRPQVERLGVIDDFCNRNRINPEQYKDALEIQALINSNPAKAWERLQPVIEHLQKYQGMSLSTDLQEAVDAGKLPLEYAQRLAAAEQQKKFVEQSTAQQNLHSQQQVLFNTLSSWEKQTFQTDPDYARKQQMVIDRFVALSASKPWQTPDQALGLVNQAYTDVNSTIQGFVPKPPPIKNLSSTALPSASVEPKTWDDVEKTLVAKYASR